jgi:sulfonate transport system ATP-binding protein
MGEVSNGVQIDIRNLSKQFGTTPVLKNIDLTIEPGQFVALVGQSGCGKSTLLRLISNLETPSEGTIALGGSQVRRINKDVRFLFQDPRLLPWRTEIKNVVLGDPEHDLNRALQALQAVDLERKAEKWPYILSGGERQRVALARALVGKPKLLLLDEPLGALDALTRINMQALIEKLWLKQGFSVVLVTHDVNEAVTLADRIVLLEDGHVAMDLQVALARPRLPDSSFAYYAKRVLDRVMRYSDERPKELETSFAI